MKSEPKSILVVTGEPSGEEHAARLVCSLRNAWPGRSYKWFGTGGSKMAAQGVELMTEVDSLAAIGPVAASSNLFNYLSLFRELRKRIRRSPPDVAVLVDFPEFNLRLAPSLKKLGVPVCYFVSPQVWAWRPGRIRKIKNNVSKMFVIFPFEAAFYHRHGVEAIYVGNPMARLSKSHSVEVGPEDGKARIALLPGSRQNEIGHILPIQLEVASRIQSKIPSCFHVLAAPGVHRSILESSCQEWKRRHGVEMDIQVVKGPIEEQLPWADCAIVKSGTSTLQAMVLGIPFAMVYRMSKLSYLLLRPLVRSQSYCLANLVAGKKIVPEFVQGEAKAEAISAYLIELLLSSEKMQRVKQKLQNASNKLGTLDAYKEAAKHIVSFVENSKK